MSNSFSIVYNLDSVFIFCKSGSFYKRCMEDASKYLQNDEEEDDHFVLWFYAVISLGSLKEKEKKNLKRIYLFLTDKPH